MKLFIRQAVTASLLLTLSGCTLISLSALSSVAALGNSSVSQGRDAYFFGKLKTAEMAQFNQIRLAVKATAREFGLRSKAPETLTHDRSEMGFIDDHNTPIGVRIDRQASNLVRVRLDVGLFGSEGTERLFLMRLRAHLPDATSRPSE